MIGDVTPSYMRLGSSQLPAGLHRFLEMVKDIS